MFWILYIFERKILHGIFGCNGTMEAFDNTIVLL